MQRAGQTSRLGSVQGVQRRDLADVWSYGRINSSLHGVPGKTSNCIDDAVPEWPEPLPESGMFQTSLS